MAYVTSGLMMPSESVVPDVQTMPMLGGFSFLPTPESQHNSEAGLDHAEWAAKVAADIDGKVVYIEAEFFGGVGSQAAMGWDRGKPDFGPLRTQTEGEDRAGFESTSAEHMAINAALRWLGVAAAPLKDEFATIGLDRLR
jgi:hypothetical protein